MSNPLERLRTEYGKEYPDAITLDGVRMALRRERDFSREYSTDDGKYRFLISRFNDGSASITLPEVRAAWPNWSEGERRDFCYACDWLGDHPHPDLPDILRFVMGPKDPTHASWIAGSVARRLPRDEAFSLLCEALRAANGECTANIAGGIARTKHPMAKPILHEHLDGLWGQADLWKDDPFTNWRAFDVTCCIKNLLELGAAPDEFEDKVRLLATHPCQGNRHSCSTHLRQSYAWLPRGTSSASGPNPELQRTGCARHLIPVTSGSR